MFNFHRFRLYSFVSLVVLITGCSNTVPEEFNIDSQISVLVMARDVSVKTKRVPLIVYRGNMQRLDNQLNQLSFEYKHVDDNQFSSLSNTIWRPWPVKGGAYVTNPTFNRPGLWEFKINLNGINQNLSGSTFMEIKNRTSTPEIGDDAPLAKTETANNIQEVTKISSAQDPDLDFYSISLDEAILNGKPTVVVFSTPAFCVTQTCGPQLKTLIELKKQYKNQIDFIHIEIWQNIREMLTTGDRSISQLSPAVEAWGLVTEPWTFFIDKNGKITAKFEQYVSKAELQESVLQFVDK